MPKHGEMAVCKTCGRAIVWREYCGNGFWVHYLYTRIAYHIPKPKEEQRKDEKDTSN